MVTPLATQKIRSCLAYENNWLIGGMSWESTETYYRLINQSVKNQLGGLHSAKLF